MNDSYYLSLVKQHCILVDPGDRIIEKNFNIGRAALWISSSCYERISITVAISKEKLRLTRVKHRIDDVSQVVKFSMLSNDVQGICFVALRYNDFSPCKALLYRHETIGIRDMIYTHFDVRGIDVIYRLNQYLPPKIQELYRYLSNVSLHDMECIVHRVLEAVEIPCL
jgi:hypothetical protein